MYIHTQVKGIGYICSHSQRQRYYRYKTLRWGGLHVEATATTTSDGKDHNYQRHYLRQPSSNIPTILP